MSRHHSAAWPRHRQAADARPFYDIWAAFIYMRPIIVVSNTVIRWRRGSMFPLVGAMKGMHVPKLAISFTEYRTA